jgi:hypothetical protein
LPAQYYRDISVAYQTEAEPISRFPGSNPRSRVNARTVAAVTEAIAKLLDEYTVEECANYLINSGYGST